MLIEKSKVLKILDKYSEQAETLTIDSDELLRNIYNQVRRIR